MPAVPVPMWGEEPMRGAEGGFEDMLLAPVAPPKPDPEQTPEERRAELFYGEGTATDNYANEEPGGFHRAGRDASEVCVMTGWPPRHIQIGSHCPHGLAFADEEDEIIDYTR